MARKRIRKKSSINSVGNKNNEQLDNLFTLIKSNNDAYDGCIDYIYFRVLKTDPVMYYNIHEECEEYTDKDKRLAQRNYNKFYSNNNFSKTILDEIEEIVDYIREESILLEYIEPIFNNYYIEKSYKFNADFITKMIFKYYTEEKLDDSIVNW